jgi:LysR family transcriptional activator of nhaA
MEWLNYHHLLYFWTVAREGTVVRAAEVLRLSQPTVSSQVRALEERLGTPLFRREGRRLVPTDTGREVFRYADEIFALGREMVATVERGGAGRPMRFVVGVADVLSKLTTYRLLSPALRLPDGVRIVCREDRVDRLLAALAVHDIDLVLSDTPVPSQVRVQAYNHLLGESAVSLFARPAVASRLRRSFPASLDGAPVLWPAEGTVLRRQLDDWVQAAGVRPAIVGEFDDSALMKTFAEHGAGAFAAASVLKAELKRTHGVVPVATLRGVKERYYAISAERRIRHPAVAAIADRARAQLPGGTA